MSDLLSELARKYGTDKMLGAHGYTPIYDAFFHERRDLVRKVLEVGIFEGASLKMWHDYFPNADIWGIDVSAQGVRNFVEGDWHRVHFIIGDVKTVQIPEKDFDLIVDDGSHEGLDVVTAYHRLAPLVRPDGVYVIEDLRAAEEGHFKNGLWFMWGSGEGAVQLKNAFRE
jgi:trans-aconitate methyltransferase